MKRFKWLIDLSIITLFVWVISGILTGILGHILYDIPVSSGKIAGPSSHLEAKSKGIMYYDIIQDRDIFDVKKTTSTPSESPSDEDVIRPIAEMGLTLKGTITGPRDIARAIIEDKGKQSLYKIGDTIKNAVLIAIYRNKVIMEVGGVEQMLVIKETKTKDKKTARYTPGRRSAQVSAPSLPADITDIMQNLDKYIGKARIVPYFKGGQPYGFRVSNVDRSSLLYEMGARSGDIVKSINGMPIRTPEDAFNAYQELKDESSVEVELERRGKSMTLTCPLR
ncbi:MAG: type II secretion system protein GspC [Deltaproteobacteria bacterium]|nr:type II secretion system protein GspC [Deltaproteobacteria bacterium]